MPQPDDTELVEVDSPFDFVTTLRRIEEAIAAAHLTVFARIDHATAARTADLDMPPATVLTYGHPKGGTPVMLAAPRVALDLPLRVLVRQDDGHVRVAYHPAAPMLRRAGVPPALATRLDAAQHLLHAALKP